MDVSLVETPDPEARAARPVVRARRFPLALRIQYRPVNDQGWRTVVSFDISRSGILISAAPLPVGQHVKIRVALPTSVTVVCDGMVARVENQRWMAFSIDRFVFERGPAEVADRQEPGVAPGSPGSSWRPCLWPISAGPQDR